MSFKSNSAAHIESRSKSNIGHGVEGLSVVEQGSCYVDAVRGNCTLFVRMLINSREPKLSPVFSAFGYFTSDSIISSEHRRRKFDISINNSCSDPA